MEEILIYNEIFSFTASRFLEEMQAAKNKDISIRVNSPGGSPTAAFGMIAKMNEHVGKINLKVDGKADSMAAFTLCYADSVTCLDVSTFLFHRAAYGFHYESESMTEAERSELIDMNNKLRAALEAKINVSEFERVTGYSIDQLFDLNSRIDVRLNSEQAKLVGLVDEIVTITPSEVEAFAERAYRMVASSLDSNHPPQKPKAKKEPKDKNSNKNHTMTVDELKAKHPELFASVVKNAQESAVAQERDRVSSWMVFADVDLKAVKDGVENGKALSATATAELNRKAVSKEALAKSEKDGAESDGGETGKDEAIAESEKEVLAFEKELDKLNAKK